MRNRALLFWKEHPALFVGITLLIGTGHFLSWDTPWPSFLWAIYLLYLKTYPHLLILIAAIAYGWGSLPPEIDVPEKPISALFAPSALRPFSTPFQQGLLYEGTLSLPTRKIPCSFFLQKEKKRLRGDMTYEVIGMLQKPSQRGYRLKLQQYKPAFPQHSLAELRYQSKKKLKHLLFTHLPSKQSATCLSSLATGDVESRWLRYQFARTGLQHLLAISGFHFALLIALLSKGFSFFSKRSLEILLLWISMSAYFLFIGNSASIGRAWIVASFYLLGKWINRPPTPLNLLGIALAIEIIFHPSLGGEIGFQLSFASSFGILLFFPLIDQKLQQFLPKRSKKQRKELPLVQRPIALFSSFFRATVSICLAVNLTLLPLLLFHFHEFPLLSFLYNLFIPHLIGLAFLCLTLALTSHLFLPFLSFPLFQLANGLTSQILGFTENPLTLLETSILINSFPGIYVLFYLFLLSHLTIFFQKWRFSPLPCYT